MNLTEDINFLIFESDTVNIIMYLLILVFAIFVFYFDMLENLCPGGFFSETCDPSFKNSVTLHGTQAQYGDSPEIIINKTIKASHAFRDMIRWRSAFILAFAISLLFWIFNMEKIPHWTSFYLTVLLAFIVIYFYFNIDSHHVLKDIDGILTTNLKALRQFC